MSKDENVFYPTSRDEFFNLIQARVEELRNDESVTELFLLAIHEPTDEHPKGGASFVHNLPDNMYAAHMCNNLCANIYMHEQAQADNATKN